MTETLITQLGVAGIVVLILVLGMRWMADQNKAMQSKPDANQAACQEREKELTKRIQQVEDRQNGEQSSLLAGAVRALEDSASALKINARAFEHYADETGKHRIREG